MEWEGWSGRQWHACWHFTGKVLMGQWFEEDFNQVGEFHHSSCSRNSEGYRPHDAQSAGLSTLSTLLQRLRGTDWTIIDTRFPTKGLNHRRFLASQLRTTVLSVQAKMLSVGMSRACLILYRNFARSWAPHNSSHGIDNRLIGATFIFEVTSEMCTCPDWSCMRRYTTPAYASSEDGY